jgi:hypothetical protein
MVQKPQNVTICGGFAPVCKSCHGQGYSVFNGTGGDEHQLSLHGKHLRSYGPVEAYGIDYLKKRYPQDYDENYVDSE